MKTDVESRESIREGKGDGDLQRKPGSQIKAKRPA